MDGSGDGSPWAFETLHRLGVGYLAVFLLLRLDPVATECSEAPPSPPLAPSARVEASRMPGTSPDESRRSARKTAVVGPRAVGCREAKK